MTEKYQLEPCLEQAIIQLEAYILETTGKKPSQQEISLALSKYFVLKEIREFIEMSRAG